MKDKVKNRGGMSVYQLKQQFAAILARELQDCGYHVVLGFESDPGNRICTLRFGDERRLALWVNLGYVPFCGVGSTEMLRVRYCALFIAEYIRQIRRAETTLPGDYFEGLALLNAAAVRQAGKKLRVCSPLRHRDRKPRRSFCLGPLEISSAIRALNRIRVSAWAELSEEDMLELGTAADRLLLYAGLPEICYTGKNLPVYALWEALRKAENLDGKDPETGEPFPILSLAAQLGRMTGKDLLLELARSDDEFLLGAALRVAAFLQPWQQAPFETEMPPRLAEAMKRYLEYSGSYYRESPDSRLLADNWFAVRTAVRSINGYLFRYGLEPSGGSIHITG